MKPNIGNEDMTMEEKASKEDKDYGFLIVFIIFIIFVLSLFGFFWWAIYDAIKNNNTEKQYCGKVTDKFRTDAGYKVSAVPHLVFKPNNLNKKVDVEVSWNTFANKEIGDEVCFTLTDRDLK